MTIIATEIELQPLIPVTTKDKPTPLLDSALPYLGAVKVYVSVRVGSADLSVAELLKLELGGVLPLDRLVDEPLDVMVDEHVVARGSLVAVGEHFGVRITEATTAGLPRTAGNKAC